MHACTRHGGSFEHTFVIFYFFGQGKGEKKKRFVTHTCMHACMHACTRHGGSFERTCVCVAILFYFFIFWAGRREKKIRDAHTHTHMMHETRGLV